MELFCTFVIELTAFHRPTLLNVEGLFFLILGYLDLFEIQNTDSPIYSVCCMNGRTYPYLRVCERRRVEGRVLCVDFLKFLFVILTL